MWKIIPRKFSEFHPENTHTHTHTHTHISQIQATKQLPQREIEREKDGKKQKVGLRLPQPKHRNKGVHIYTQILQKKAVPKEYTPGQVTMLSQSSRTASSDVNMFSKYDIHTLAENATYTYSACRV